MREITYYIADDGTQFKSEDECMEYEITTHLIENINDNNMDSIRIWDEAFRPLSISDRKTLEDIESLLNYAYYVVGTDEEALHYLFHDLGYDYFGISGFPYDGVMKANVRYYYDDDIDEFREFDAQYGKIIEFNDKFKVGE